MTTFPYTPSDPKIHREGAINRLCAAFQTHEAGLPELLKNSSDEYARLDRGEHERVIVLILQNGKGDRAASVAALDFGGMTSSVIDNKFSVWADPDAAASDSGAEVQGGHGNGSKCYLTRMFKDHARLVTVKHGLACRYGVAGGSYDFGYSPDESGGKDVPVTDIEAHLRSALEELGTSFDLLPEAAKAAFAASKGYTLFVGVDPKHWANRLPVQRIIDDLVEHPQMIRTLEHCNVYVIGNGKLQNADPLRKSEIEPLPNGVAPRVIGIPADLVDPVTGDTLDTTAGGTLPVGELVLRTSKVSLQRRKVAGVTYRAVSGYIGFEGTETFDVQSPYRWKIYGTCDLKALEEAKQNDRGPLATSPLTRAVRLFIAKQIETYAKEFEEIDRRASSQEERDELSRINEMLDSWKNRVLSDVAGIGLDDGDGVGPDPDPRERLKKGNPTHIELHLGTRRAGVGVSIKPTPAFFEGTERIRAHGYRFVSSDPSIIEVDDELLVLTTLRPGKVDLHVEVLKSGLQSPSVTMEVVEITEITMPPATEVQVHGRSRIVPLCILGTGESATDVLLNFSTSNDEVAMVSAAGVVFGVMTGTAEVVACDDMISSTTTTRVHVVPADDEDEGAGRGKPRILISGVEKDPATGSEVNFPADDPPVTQRPQDHERHIWWINSAAPLAKFYLEKYGPKSREWRSYHVERLIEAMVQIVMTHENLIDDAMSGSDWIRDFGTKVSDIQAAAVEGLAAFIVDGEDPSAGDD